MFGDVSRQSTELKDPLQSSTGSTHLKKTKSPQIDEGKPKEENVEPNTALEEPPASISKKKELEVGKSKDEVLLDDGFKVVRAEKTEKSTDLFPERKGDYKFPTLELLMEPPEISSGGDEDHMIKAKRLKETLHEFKIDVEIGEVHTGPVITRYDIHPAAGVRVEKIANLDKNLAMALMADGVRILAPVPGKGCVGVEVPNDISAPVCLKEILQSKAWADANAEIPIVLGKEASGKPLVADLNQDASSIGRWVYRVGEDRLYQRDHRFFMLSFKSRRCKVHHGGSQNCGNESLQRFTPYAYSGGHGT